MSNFDVSRISIDFCSLFDGVIRLRFTVGDLSVTYDYDSLCRCVSPVVNVERIDTFVRSYDPLRPYPLDDDCFYLDLPTAFGYRSSYGKWLTTGGHHARITFDYHALFES